jgi:transposase
MNKITKAKNHLDSKDVKAKIKNTIGFWKVQKWLIVYNALEFPRKAEDIAKHLAVSVSLVNKTISEYNRFGAVSIETKGKGGRRNCYMSEAEEQEFMERFIDDARKGLIATATVIHKAFEEKIGKKVHKTTIYRLLERTGWRKIVPLPAHPKKNVEEQESFKKTSIKTLKK